jgi:flagellar biosynthesis/type III secretory pathway protein FliH
MAQETLTIRLEKEVKKVQVISSTVADGFAQESDNSVQGAGPATQEGNDFSELAGSLRMLVEKINRFYENIFSMQQEAVVRLSVEIARKIISIKTAEGSYDIESIIKQALANCPVKRDLVVYVSPKDYNQLLKLKAETASAAFDGVELVSDSGIGQAECIIKSPKGIIKSLIDEQLERIYLALEDAVKQ